MPDEAATALDMARWVAEAEQIYRLLYLQKSAASVREYVSSDLRGKPTLSSETYYFVELARNYGVTREDTYDAVGSAAGGLYGITVQNPWHRGPSTA